MKGQTFFTLASSVFLIVAIAHLLRVIMGFDLIVAGWPVPIWVNTVAFVVAGFLAYSGIKLRKNKN